MVWMWSTKFRMIKYAIDLMLRPIMTNEVFFPSTIDTHITWSNIAAWNQHCAFNIPVWLK